ncbi:type IV secretion system protein [bacterium]|nr:MAG: type IV secretion system protein [bacterium]
MKPTHQDNPTVAQWHKDIYGSALVSRNRWFVLGIVALIVATLEAGALMALAPLKAVEPYVIQVDNDTGMTTILEPLKEKSLTENEAITKFFIVKYIVARETYDPQDLNQNYERVRMMSTGEEAARFEDFLRGPDGPVESFKTTTTRSIRIRSVSFLNKSTAQVRFTATKRQIATNEKQETHWIATLSYRYVNTPLEEGERMDNPLGFQIKNYRIDQEVVK